MARILVTGVAGFIGSSLSRELIVRGHKVRGIDDLSGGTLANINDLLPELDFEHADQCNQALVKKLCQGVDVVFHQGAIPSVPRSVLDPLGSHRANVDGTLSVLLAARDAGVRRVVYAGSSSAYGESLTLPKHEAMAIAPISPYAVQKVTGELYMQSFAKIYPLETVTLRYFNVFGPHQAADSPYSGVLAKFITAMLAGQRPTIFGDGSQSRDFTYIQNVVEANILAALAPAHLIRGKVYNIACGERHSLSETYDILGGMLAFYTPPVFAESRTADIQHSLADITRATSDLGYKPSVGFIEGLRRTVEWYKTQTDRSSTTAKLTDAALLQPV
ncbi:MAG: SDR family oxidoreductase [Acidobacteria bacterium]|nr:SDR family oxidoreductase [Acidobacteriota bacterium]